MHKTGDKSSQHAFVTAMQHAHKKEGNAQMAFTAKLDMLRHNASKIEDGGGPHTLICKECDKAFDWGDEISGPTRNRAGVPTWNHTRSDNRSHYHKLQYWHQDCKHPKGVLRNPPAEVEVIVGSNNKDGWQRPTPTSPIALPSPSPSPVITPHTPVLPVSNDNAAGVDVVTAIMQVINGHLLPELEKVTDALDSKIDAHISESAPNSIRDIERRVTNIEVNLDATIARIVAIEASQPLIIKIERHDAPPVTINAGRQHKQFHEILDTVLAGAKNIWITGPPGSGKSEAAKHVARALDLPFDVQGIVSDPIELVGYMNANGEYVTTNFRRRFENTSTGGGIICLDEIDGWEARSGLVANGALANGHCAFPDGTVERHPNCIVIATANTWGAGATAEFIGRNKLDETTLDRFETIAWEYDASFERYLATLDGTSSMIDAYISAVISTRALCVEHKAKLQITPRASISGTKLLRGGMNPATVLARRFARYQSHNMWTTVGRPLEDWARIYAS